MKKDIVLPGDELSTTEELLVGDGTFEEDGIIRAARMGIYKVDDKKREATVEPLTSTPVIIKKGDEVLASAGSVRSMMVIAEVFHVIGKKRSVSGDTNGTIHVSEISSGYVKNADDLFALGDIIRAKVIQTEPSLQLSTKGNEYGAIKSICMHCRSALIKKDNMLECGTCNHKEKRKMANDYGSYDLTKF
jgi:exosome complex component CSL4